MKKTNNKFYQRVLALVLAVMLCVGMMPLAAFANEGEVTEPAATSESTTDTSDSDTIVSQETDTSSQGTDSTSSDEGVENDTQKPTDEDKIPDEDAGEDGNGTEQGNPGEGNPPVAPITDEANKTVVLDPTDNAIQEVGDVGVPSAIGLVPTTLTTMSGNGRDGQGKESKSTPTPIEADNYVYVYITTQESSGCTFPNLNPNPNPGDWYTLTPVNLAGKLPSAAGMEKDNYTYDDESYRNPHVNQLSFSVTVHKQDGTTIDGITKASFNWKLHTSNGAPGSVVPEGQEYRTFWHLDGYLNTYTVTYKNGYGGVIQSDPDLLYGDKTPTCADPTREGWTFTGWKSSVDGKVYSTVPETVTQNVTYTAQWKQNTYTLQYDANADTDTVTGMPADVTEHSPAGETSRDLGVTGNPTRDNYVFKGWNTNLKGTGTKYTAGDKITVNSGETVILYAQWEGKYNYELIYDPNDGTGGPGSDSSGSTAATEYKFKVKADEPTREGYEFLGWADSANATTAKYKYKDTITVEQPSKTIYAVWQQLYTYSLAYDTCGGTGGPSGSSFGPTADTEHPFPVDSTKKPTLDNFEFAGWYDNADYTGSPVTAPVTATVRKPNIILYAKWVGANAFSLVYHPNADADTVTVPDRVDVTMSSETSNEFDVNTGNLTRAGWVFTGWNTQRDGTGTSYAVNSVNGKITATKANPTCDLYAQWKKLYNVTYEWTLPEGVTIGKSEPTDPNEYEEGKPVKVDATFNEGDEVTGKDGKTYVFSGWDVEVNGDGEFTMPDHNVVISGTWTEKAYTVTYDWGTLPEDLKDSEILPTDSEPSRTAGSHFTVDTKYTKDYKVTIAGGKRIYVFSGWTVPDSVNTETEGEYEGQRVMPAQNVVIKGQWLRNFILTYHKNGGSTEVTVVDTLENIVGEVGGFTIKDLADTALANFKLDGYEFLGWNEDKEAKEADTVKLGFGKLYNVYQNTDLYAIWKAINYTVVYTDGLAGEVFADRSFDKLDPDDPDSRGLNQGDTTPPFDGDTSALSYVDGNNVRQNFAGWQLTSVDPSIPNVQGTINAAHANGDRQIIYTAKWTNRNAFTLNYDGNGGTPPAVSSITVTEESNEPHRFTLDAVATRPGYTFAGWSTESGENNADGRVTEINCDPNTSVTVYAIWTPNYYTVTYTDGVIGQVVFGDQVTNNLRYGVATPTYTAPATYTNTADGLTYRFTEWTPSVAATVTDTVTYTANWEVAPVGPTPTPTPTATPTPTPTPSAEPTDEPTDIPDPEPPLTDSPDVTPDPEPSEPPVEIPEEDPPLAEIPDDDPPLAEIPDGTTEIDDEEVPLADVPKTGDDAKIWLTLALLSAAGLGVLGLTQRRTRKSGKHS